MGGLTTEAAGQFATAEEAVIVFSDAPAPYFQIVAFAANAAVDEPLDLIVYAPPFSPKGRGEYVVQRHASLRAPASYVRKVHAHDLMVVIQALEKHSAQERLQRAMAHYRMALMQLDSMT